MISLKSTNMNSNNRQNRKNVYINGMKNKSYPELIMERDQLIDYIREYEKKEQAQHGK